MGNLGFITHREHDEFIEDLEATAAGDSLAARAAVATIARALVDRAFDSNSHSEPRSEEIDVARAASQRPSLIQRARKFDALRSKDIS